MDKIFPDNFPDNCPPEDAKEEEIEVYRLCYDPLSNKDYDISYNINRHPNDVRAYGYSVNVDKQETLNLKKMHYFKNKKVYKGLTYKKYGVIKHTPTDQAPTHHTWWLYTGARPFEDFKKDEE